MGILYECVQLESDENALIRLRWISICSFKLSVMPGYVVYIHVIRHGLCMIRFEIVSNDDSDDLSDGDTVRHTRD